MAVELADLAQDIAAAHAEGRGRDLVRLYTRLADHHEDRCQIDAACFYLTYALIYALETGDEAQIELHKRLCVYEREE